MWARNSTPAPEYKWEEGAAALYTLYIRSTDHDVEFFIRPPEDAERIMVQEPGTDRFVEVSLQEMRIRIHRSGTDVEVLLQRIGGKVALRFRHEDYSRVVGIARHLFEDGDELEPEDELMTDEGLEPEEKEELLSELGVFLELCLPLPEEEENVLFEAEAIVSRFLYGEYLRLRLRLTEEEAQTIEDAYGRVIEAMDDRFREEG